MRETPVIIEALLSSGLPKLQLPNSALCSIHFEAQCFNRMFSLADLEGESGSTLTIVQYMQQMNLLVLSQNVN